MDCDNLNISYMEFKEITENRLRNRMKMKEQADQPHEYAVFHAQGQAIIDMWYDIALKGKLSSEQVAEDYVYFKNIIEPSRW